MICHFGVHALEWLSETFRRFTALCIFTDNLKLVSDSIAEEPLAGETRIWRIISLYFYLERIQILYKHLCFSVCESEIHSLSSLKQLHNRYKSHVL